MRSSSLFFGLRPSTKTICAVLVMMGCTLHQVHSYVVGGTSPEFLMNSRLADIQCKLIMSVGRTPDTEMPPEWAASGAKLGIPLDIHFSTQECVDPTMNQETLLSVNGIVPPYLAAVPLNEPSFVSANGVETVKVLPGAYSCQVQRIESGMHSFRFFMDFPEGATRNDVVLPAERIYFMTAFWNEDDNLMQKADGWKDDIVESLEKINVELNDMEQNPIGSLQKMGFRKYLILTEKRKKLAAQIEMLEDTFPPKDRLVKGPNNMSFLKKGVIAVKRYKGKKEQYHWVGTFEFNKVWRE